MRLRNCFALSLILVSTVSSGSNLYIPQRSAFAMRVVVLHNQVRSGASVRPVIWDYGLAAAADNYARQLAATGRWGHSPSFARPGQGENLWMGTRGAFALEQMIGSWSLERRFFRGGSFPSVSRTGSWHDVGHYTQMIWPGSTRIGCALRSSSRNDYLVCRYSPAGNVIGARLP